MRNIFRMNLKSIQMIACDDDDDECQINIAHHNK